jgi:CheY-like chemotaxis protein
MPRNILIVDDEPAFRFGVSLALRVAGYSIQEAQNGLEALMLMYEKQVKGEQFDFILLDSNMRIMSGLDFVKMMEDEKLNVPFLIVSGFLDSDVMRLLRSPRCMGFLGKPVQAKSIVNRLNGYFQPAVDHDTANKEEIRVS